jgi:osmotically-inducible protein OsmY
MMVTPFSDISSRVSGDLLEDERTKNIGHQIEVTADRGIIILTGTVPNENVRSAALEIARNAPGVITVRDELKVKG